MLIFVFFGFTTIPSALSSKKNGGLLTACGRFFLVQQLSDGSPKNKLQQIRFWADACTETRAL
jgi:hypothetical protein